MNNNVNAVAFIHSVLSKYYNINTKFTIMNTIVNSNNINYRTKFLKPIKSRKMLKNLRTYINQFYQRKLPTIFTKPPDISFSVGTEVCTTRSLPHHVFF